MARHLLDHPYLAEASEACGVDVRRALERWTPDLARTSVLQPALVAVSLADFGDKKADAVCGHSVGEIAAFAASGAISAKDAIRFAARRGRAMEQAAAGGMVSFDDREIDPHPMLDLAARNGPHQVVQSGALEHIEEMLVRGAKRLPVSGAWHSRLMKSVVLEPIPFGKPKCTFITCLDGTVCDAPDFQTQIAKPVRWDLVMQTLRGYDFVCPGPKKVLRALIRVNFA